MGNVQAPPLSLDTRAERNAGKEGRGTGLMSSTEALPQVGSGGMIELINKANRR